MDRDTATRGSVAASSRVAALVAVLLMALAGCGQQTTTPASAPTSGQAAQQATSGDKLKVVATTTIVGDVVKNIGGDLIDLTVLMQPGVDPHSFEFTPQDVAKVADSDIVFVNGAGLEEFLTSLLENAGNNVNVVPVSEGITLIPFKGEHAEGEHEGEHGHEGEAAHGAGEDGHESDHAEGTPVADAEEHEGEHAHEGGDPHVWWNPQNVGVWADTIAKALAEKDSANAPAFEANAAAYKAELQELDSWIKEQVGQVPEANRKLVTDHDTFGYLADRYGFELVGAVLPNSSTQAEVSAQDLAALQDAIKAYNVKAVFVGSTVNPSLAQRVADDTGTRLVQTYTDSLGEPASEAATYIDFMRTSVAAIVNALK
jgi:ABC-type Zn uptake system ZnuABC Zn-binding protein ZnuA